MNNIRKYIRRLLIEQIDKDLQTAFYEEMQGVTSGREAKKVFAKYVDQDYFAGGTMVHWVGSVGKVKKFIQNPRPKDEISANFYRDGSTWDWHHPVKKPIGLIVDGWVTYAAKENIFTGGTPRRPRKKADRVAYDHRLASSGWNKYPYSNKKHAAAYDYAKDIAVGERIIPSDKIGDMEPFGPTKDKIQQLGDDAWMATSDLPDWKNWNEVLIDNWEVTGLIIGTRRGRGWGVSNGDIKNMEKLSTSLGLPLKKIGEMS